MWHVTDTLFSPANEGQTKDGNLVQQLTTHNCNNEEVIIATTVLEVSKIECLCFESLIHFLSASECLYPSAISPAPNKQMKCWIVYRQLFRSGWQQG